MMEVKVLGTGCSNCKATVKLVEEVAKAKGAPINLEKVEDIQDIMKFNILSTPGVVIDGKVVHAGGIPAREKVESWF
jgi:small redox-active disulfide protein 2